MFFGLYEANLTFEVFFRRVHIFEFHVEWDFGGSLFSPSEIQCTIHKGWMIRH